MEVKELSFEETMKELQKTVSELESGSLSLEDSVKKYQYGLELSKHANLLLQEAEAKITVKED